MTFWLMIRGYRYILLLSNSLATGRQGLALEYIHDFGWGLRALLKIKQASKTQKLIMLGPNWLFIMAGEWMAFGLNLNNILLSIMPKKKENFLYWR